MEIGKIGIISDTHGILREEVYDFFKGCDLVLHAGDIINEITIEKLEEIFSNVMCVRGNNDYMLPLDKYPISREIVINNKIKVFLIHDLSSVDLNFAKYDIVIHGHTHKPDKKNIKNTLIINPGSFGPKRFSLPISLAVLNIKLNNEYDVFFHELNE